MLLNSYPNLRRLHYKISIAILFCVHVCVRVCERETELAFAVYINQTLLAIIYISTDAGSHQNYQQEESKWDFYILKTIKYESQMQQMVKHPNHTKLCDHWRQISLITWWWNYVLAATSWMR